MEGSNNDKCTHDDTEEFAIASRAHAKAYQQLISCFKCLCGCKALSDISPLDYYLTDRSISSDVQHNQVAYNSQINEPLVEQDSYVFKSPSVSDQLSPRSQTSSIVAILEALDLLNGSIQQQLPSSSSQPRPTSSNCQISLDGIYAKYPEDSNAHASNFGGVDTRNLFTTARRFTIGTRRVQSLPRDEIRSLLDAHAPLLMSSGTDPKLQSALFSDQSVKYGAGGLEEGGGKLYLSQALHDKLSALQRRYGGKLGGSQYYGGEVVSVGEGNEKELSQGDVRSCCHTCSDEQASNEGYQGILDNYGEARDCDKVQVKQIRGVQQKPKQVKSTFSTLHDSTLESKSTISFYDMSNSVQQMYMLERERLKTCATFDLSAASQHSSVAVPVAEKACEQQAKCAKYPVPPLRLYTMGRSGHDTLAIQSTRGTTGAGAFGVDGLLSARSTSRRQVSDTHRSSDATDSLTDPCCEAVTSQEAAEQVARQQWNKSFSLSVPRALSSSSTGQVAARNLSKIQSQGEKLGNERTWARALGGNDSADSGTNKDLLISATWPPNQFQVGQFKVFINQLYDVPVDQTRTNSVQVQAPPARDPAVAKSTSELVCATSARSQMGRQPSQELHEGGRQAKGVSRAGRKRAKGSYNWNVFDRKAAKDKQQNLKSRWHGSSDTQSQGQKDTFQVLLGELDHTSSAQTESQRYKDGSQFGKLFSSSYLCGSTAYHSVETQSLCASIRGQFLEYIQQDVNSKLRSGSGNYQGSEGAVSSFQCSSSDQNSQAERFEAWQSLTRALHDANASDDGGNDSSGVNSAFFSAHSSFESAQGYDSGSENQFYSTQTQFDLGPLPSQQARIQQILGSQQHLNSFQNTLNGTQFVPTDQWPSMNFLPSNSRHTTTQEHSDDDHHGGLNPPRGAREAPTQFHADSEPFSFSPDISGRLAFRQSCTSLAQGRDADAGIVPIIFQTAGGQDEASNGGGEPAKKAKSQSLDDKGAEVLWTLFDPKMKQACIDDYARLDLPTNRGLPISSSKETVENKYQQTTTTTAITTATSTTAPPYSSKRLGLRARAELAMNPALKQQAQQQLQQLQVNKQQQEVQGKEGQESDSGDESLEQLWEKIQQVNSGISQRLRSSQQLSNLLSQHTQEATLQTSQLPSSIAERLDMSAASVPEQGALLGVGGANHVDMPTSSSAVSGAYIDRSALNQNFAGSLSARVFSTPKLDHVNTNSRYPNNAMKSTTSAVGPQEAKMKQVETGGKLMSPEHPRKEAVPKRGAVKETKRTGMSRLLRGARAAVSGGDNTFKTQQHDVSDKLAQDINERLGVLRMAASVAGKRLMGYNNSTCSKQEQQQQQQQEQSASGQLGFLPTEANLSKLANCTFSECQALALPQEKRLLAYCRACEETFEWEPSAIFWMWICSISKDNGLEVLQESQDLNYS